MILVSSSGICCAASGDAIRKLSAAILTTFIIYKPLTISCDEATERVAGTPVWDLLLRAKHLFVAALLRVAPGATATACPAATLRRFSRLTNGCGVSAFANCGRAVAHVRGSYGPRCGHSNDSTARMRFSLEAP